MMEPTGIILFVVVAMATCSSAMSQGNQKNNTENVSTTFGSRLSQVDVVTGQRFSPETTPKDEIGSAEDAQVDDYLVKFRNEQQGALPWLTANESVSSSELELVEQFLRFLTANPAADGDEMIADDQSRDQSRHSQSSTHSKVLDGQTDLSVPSLTAENMASIDSRHDSWLNAADDSGQHPRSKRDLYRTSDARQRLPSTLTSESTEISNGVDNDGETNLMQSDENLMDSYEYDHVPKTDVEENTDYFNGGRWLVKVDEKRLGAGRSRNILHETDRNYDGYEEGDDSTFEKVRAVTRKPSLPKYRLSRSFYSDGNGIDGDDDVRQKNEDRWPRPQVKKPRQFQHPKQQIGATSSYAGRKVHQQRYQQQRASLAPASVSAMYDYSLYIPLTYKGAPGRFVPLVTGNRGSNRGRRWITWKTANGQGNNGPDSTHGRRRPESAGMDRDNNYKNQRLNRQKAFQTAAEAPISSKKMRRMVNAWTQMVRRQVRKALDEYDSVNQMAERIRSIASDPSNVDPWSSSEADWEDSRRK